MAGYGNGRETHLSSESVVLNASRKQWCSAVTRSLAARLTRTQVYLFERSKFKHPSVFDKDRPTATFFFWIHPGIEYFLQN